MLVSQGIQGVSLGTSVNVGPPAEMASFLGLRETSLISQLGNEAAGGQQAHLMIPSQEDTGLEKEKNSYC